MFPLNDGTHWLKNRKIKTYVTCIPMVYGNESTSWFANWQTGIPEYY